MDYDRYQVKVIEKSTRSHNWPCQGEQEHDASTSSLRVAPKESDGIVVRGARRKGLSRFRIRIEATGIEPTFN
jgi:hypothetical protein